MSVSNGVATAVRIANVGMLGVSGLFGVFALTDPERVLGHPVRDDGDVRYFRRMYGVRAVIIAVAGSVVLLSGGRTAHRTTVPALVSLTALQAADAVIAARERTPGLRGASIAAATHALSAIVLSRR